MKSEMPESYQGREQAWVKHNLLESYLEKLLMIVGMSARQGARTGSIEVCYVDCFAGPWSVDDSDRLEGTSISISLNTLAKCRAALAKLGVEAKMRALYVEKDAAAFGKLQAFLSSHAPESVEASCRNGDFVDLRPAILEWCGTKPFVFFFVDPKGWKDVGVGTMRPLLQRPRSELLINFAYNFVNRTASMSEWQDAMERLLGARISLAGKDPEEREASLVNAYRAGLKNNSPPGRGGYVPRTAYVKVLDPLRERTKYHLVYLSSHPQGIIEFMKVSATVDLIQKQVRASKRSDSRERATGVVDMFGSDSMIDLSGGRADPEAIDGYWRRYLADGPRCVDVSAFATILELTNWFPQDLQLSLLRLVKRNELRNLDADLTRRRSSPLHYEKAERLELVRP